MLQYDTLFNNPVERRRVTYPYVWWDNAFTEEQINQITSICDMEEVKPAVVYGNRDEETTREIRRSKTKFFEKNPDVSWIFDQFNYVIQSLNNQYYNFNLNGYRTFQYTIYDGEDKGMYDWHMDTILGRELDNSWDEDTRKLTMIMLLSDNVLDFKGGELELNIGRESNSQVVDIVKGKIVVFPSFILHRVKPVTSGIRKSIVVWVEGPKFI
jgi:PKHD-type hydroxylase